MREEYPDIEIESRLGGTGKAAGGPNWAALRLGRPPPASTAVRGVSPGLGGLSWWKPCGEAGGGLCPR